MAQNRVYVPPETPCQTLILNFPSKRRFYSKDDHHCLNVMLMYELQKTETKPKTTIIQYFIALNYVINYYKTVTNKPSLN